MATQGPIEGRVAGVLSGRELVINRGSDHGVQVGMRFAVVDKQAQPIKDPETGESIGSVPLVKTVVKVTRVDGPRLATARTFRTLPGTVGALGDILGSASRPESFSYEKSALVESGGMDSRVVMRNDPVVQVTGDEYG